MYHMSTQIRRGFPVDRQHCTRRHLHPPSRSISRSNLILGIHFWYSDVMRLFGHNAGQISSYGLFGELLQQLTLRLDQAPAATQAKVTLPECASEYTYAHFVSALSTHLQSRVQNTHNCSKFHAPSSHKNLCYFIDHTSHMRVLM
jgi:hypothetical protein